MLGKWAGPGAGPSLVGPGHGCIVWVLFLFLIRDVLDFVENSEMFCSTNAYYG